MLIRGSPQNSNIYNHYVETHNHYVDTQNHCVKSRSSYSYWMTTIKPHVNQGFPPPHNTNNHYVGTHNHCVE